MASSQLNNQNEKRPQVYSASQSASGNQLKLNSQVAERGIKVAIAYIDVKNAKSFFAALLRIFSSG